LADLRPRGYLVFEGFLDCDELAAQDALWLHYPRPEVHLAYPAAHAWLATDQWAGIVGGPWRSWSLNRLAFHLDLVDLAERFLGSPDLRLYEASLWAKYLGALRQTCRRSRCTGASSDVVDDALQLRDPRYEDWPRVHEWGASEAVCRYQTWGPHSPEATEAFVIEAIATCEVPASARPRLVWFAEHPRDGLIGAGELRVHSRTHRQGEISYVVHPQHWRRGYATRIGKRLLQRAFRDHALHRVFATCDPRNLASVAVLRKLGLAHEARLRHTLLLRDGWRGSDVYSILEPEWAGRPG
jgi:RimJ/RimL family protein N-acetyltransferase